MGAENTEKKSKEKENTIAMKGASKQPPRFFFFVWVFYRRGIEKNLGLGDSSDIQQKKLCARERSVRVRDVVVGVGKNWGGNETL